MGLPILKHAAHDLLRLFDQAESRWVEHLGQPEAMEVGTAYANRLLANVADANHVRDVTLPEAMSPGRAMRLVEAHFQSRETRCAYWQTNRSVPDGRTLAIIEHLLAVGFSRRTADVMRLARMPIVDVIAPADVKIIPARASYRHVREIAGELAREFGAAQAVEAAVLHLDDPHWDALLAIRDGKALATGGVLTVGEVGRIDGLYVSPPSRGQGLGRLMMLRILEICRRATLRHVMLALDPGNQVASRLLANLGLEKIGETIRYHAPSGRAPSP